MEKAMIILNNENISVAQLAFEVGYENISYFIQAFKSHYDSSPK